MKVRLEINTKMFWKVQLQKGRKFIGMKYFRQKKEVNKKNLQTKKNS